MSRCIAVALQLAGLLFTASVALGTYFGIELIIDINNNHPMKRSLVLLLGALLLIIVSTMIIILCSLQFCCQRYTSTIGEAAGQHFSDDARSHHQSDDAALRTISIPDASDASE